MDIEEKMIIKIASDIAELKALKRAFSTMYHYTSPTTALKILDKSHIELRFTRFDCVNDISEGKYAYEVYTEVCDNLYQNKEISKNYYNYLLELIQDDVISNYIALSNDTLQRIFGVSFKKGGGYICCFSTNWDSLPMWNYYVKNDIYRGINIGFHSEKMNHSLEKVKVSLYNVIYKKSEIESILRNKILEYKSYFTKNGESAKNNIACYMSILINNLKYIAKHQCFEHENEVRAIIFIDDKEEKIKKEFDWTRGFPIPYTKLTFGKDAFFMCTIGPLVDPELAIKNAKEYLGDNGYRKAVKVSKVPIRF